MQWQANDSRYESSTYKRCGQSGIKLPPLSLGFWHNFGLQDNQDEIKKIIHHAFDSGIVHFDLANNYGPPAGSAESTLGKHLTQDLKPYRDELFIATKAGWDMWPGPYGDLGSRKYLMTSLEQSLQRMNLEYVDLFYHHRPDPKTPLEETIGALKDLTLQGKCLYVGISSYSAAETQKAYTIAQQMNLPILANQVSYSLLSPEVEEELFPTLEQLGIGAIAFAPLSQGILTGKYSDGIPTGSRAQRKDGHLLPDMITPEMQNKIHALLQIAQQRGESLAQMSLAWLIQGFPASTLLGVRNLEQLKSNLQALRSAVFSLEEKQAIYQIIGSNKVSTV